MENFKKNQGRDIEPIKADRAKASGRYYRLMIDHVKKVLADPKRVVPDYDAKAGYEIAGFVWFQGWNDMVDGGNMTPAQQKEYVAQYRAKLISPKEEAMWKSGASNGGYHYLGCAKTMALIGKAFAEAILDMED